jgi:NADPH2:quinone reductase
MKAWVVRQLGAPASMTFEELDEPPRVADQLRIRVEASALNFGEILQIAGEYQTKPELPFIPGWEVAGVVEHAPVQSGFAEGDRVAAFIENEGLHKGAYATVTDADVHSAVKIPDEMPFGEAAAFFVAFQTAYFGLVHKGRLQPGETLLVHGGAGGVGSAALQLGKALGARVIAPAPGEERVRVCRDLGADVVIDMDVEDFADRINQDTDRRGVDVAFDTLGGAVFERTTKCIAFDGRIVVVGFASGSIAQAATNHMLVKNYSVHGLFWGAYRRRRPDLIAAAAGELFSRYREGKIAPRIAASYPLDQAPQALEALRSGQAVGKVVLLPPVNT